MNLGYNQQIYSTKFHIFNFYQEQPLLDYWCSLYMSTTVRTIIMHYYLFVLSIYNSVTIQHFRM